MAGDPLHAAFLAHLTTELDTCGLTPPWTVTDTRNTLDNPDASDPWVDFEIISAGVEQYTTGAPGYNLHQETGQITIAFNVPLGDEANQALAGEYANNLLKRFFYLGSRFTCESRDVRLHTPVRMGVGQDDGGMWIETMAVSFERFPVG